MTIEEKLQTIMDNNLPKPITGYGMVGGMQTFASVFCPSREKLKYKMAENIWSGRRNRQALERQGRLPVCKCTFWLDRAAFYRKKLLEVT